MNICVNRHTGEHFNIVKFDGTLDGLEVAMDKRMSMDTYRLASFNDKEQPERSYIKFQYRDNDYVMQPEPVEVYANQYILRNIKGHYFVVNQIIFDEVYALIE